MSGLVRMQEDVDQYNMSGDVLLPYLQLALGPCDGMQIRSNRRRNASDKYKDSRGKDRKVIRPHREPLYFELKEVRSQRVVPRDSR